MLKPAEHIPYQLGANFVFKYKIDRATSFK